MLSPQAHSLAPEPAVTFVDNTTVCEDDVPPVTVPTGAPGGSSGLL